MLSFDVFRGAEPSTGPEEGLLALRSDKPLSSCA